MELKEFRERLQSVGRNRLCNRPGAYPRFEHWAGTTRGVISTTAAILCMPSTLPFAERMGSVEATRRINERLAEIVDEWEQSHGPTHAIEPLPQVAPAGAIQDDAAPAPAKESASDARKNHRKKAALIRELEHEWPTVAADLHECGRNGLKEAAHTGKHGIWDMAKAREWAVTNGKINTPPMQMRITSDWPRGKTTRHTMKK